MLDKRSDIEVVVRNMDNPEYDVQAMTIRFFQDLGYDFHGMQGSLLGIADEDVLLFRKRTKGQP